MEWVNGKQYFRVSFGEMEAWLAQGIIPMTVLDAPAYVDVGFDPAQLGDTIKWKLEPK